MKASKLTVVLLLLLIAAGQESGVMVHNGMGNGQDFLEWSANQRNIYAMGAINGILLSPLFGAPKDGVRWLEDCTEGMTNHQISEIIGQYIQQHPAEWHHGLHILTYRSMLSSCTNSPANRGK